MSDDIYRANMDHDADFVTKLPRWPSILDESEMSNMLPWNVDDDNHHNNDDNRFVEKNHQHLILVARKTKKKKFSCIFRDDSLEEIIKNIHQEEKYVYPHRPNHI